MMLLLFFLPSLYCFHMLGLVNRCKYYSIFFFRIFVLYVPILENSFFFALKIFLIKNKETYALIYKTKKQLSFNIESRKFFNSRFVLVFHSFFPGKNIYCFILCVFSLLAKKEKKSCLQIRVLKSCLPIFQYKINKQYFAIVTCLCLFHLLILFTSQITNNKKSYI